MKTFKHFARLAIAAFALSSNVFAATDTWTTTSSGNWSTAGNWSGGAPVSTNALIFSSTSGGTIAANNDTTASTQYNGLTFSSGATSFNLTGNQIKLGGAVTDSSANAQTISLGQALTATQIFAVTSGGVLTDSGIISGSTFGVTKAGSGTLTLTAANTFTGATAVNDGTLKLDFTAAGAPTGATGIITGSALTLGGGTLQIVGASAGSTQAFTSTTVQAGGSVISAAPGSGTNPTVSLGALTESPGGAIEFIGPATIGSSGNVAATAIITTTTAGAGSTTAGGIIASSLDSNDYATVGLYDWASTDVAAGTVGTSPYTIIGGSQVTGFYTSPANNAGATSSSNVDVTAQQTPGIGGVGNVRFSSSGATGVSSIRFNTPNAPYIETKTNVAFLITGGVLITPNMGVVNAGIDNLELASRSLQIFQNNTQAVFVLGTNGSADFFSSDSNATDAVTINGAGTVILNPLIGVNANITLDYKNASGSIVTNGNYNGSTQVNNSAFGAIYINGGTTIINNTGDLSNPTTLGTTFGGAGTVNLNGGTLMAQNLTTNAVSLTNIAATANRAVFLGGNGGGLAAAAGTTLTVNGVVANSASTGQYGPLVIGIPASTANGNSLLGLVPGTGTAYNTAVYGTGTVILGGVNTYTGGTMIVGGVLQAGSTSAFGVGGVSFSASSTGTLALAGFNNTITDLTTNATAGTPVIENANGASVSSATLTVNTVNGDTYAGVLQDGTGGGTLALAAGGSGTLVLSGLNTYAGGTTVTGGTVKVGIVVSGTSSALGNTGSAVTVNGGGTLDLAGFSQTVGALTLGGSGSTLADSAGNNTLTASSGVTVNGTGNTINSTVTVSGAITQNASSSLTVNGAVGSDALNTSATLSGTGTLTTVTLAGSNSLNGPLTTTSITVSGTGNSIAGAVSGTITQNSSSGLTVSGTVGNDALNTSATLAGSGGGTGSVGTVTLAGSDTVSGPLTTAGIAVSGTGNNISTGTVTGNITFNGASATPAALNVAGLASGTVNVSTYSTLSGTGTTGAVTLGGTSSAINLVKSNSTVGTLTVGGLTTTGGGTLTFAIGTTSGEIDDINDTGALVLGGATNIVIENLNNVGSQSIVNGSGTTYLLLATTGVSGAGSLSLSTTSLDGYNLSLSQSGNDYYLNVVAATYYYTGTVSTDFTDYHNFNTGASNGAQQVAAFSSTSDVTIGTTSPMPGNLTPVANSNISINSLTFASSGAGAMLSGTGTVSLAAASGTGITDNAGIGADTETVAAAVSLGANQSWATSANSTLNVTGAISGAHSLALTGSGTYKLGGANTFSGLTVGTGLDSPMVLLTNGNNGSATGTTTLTVHAGATLGGTGTSSGTSFGISGTGTATASRANVLVGLNSASDTSVNTTLTLEGAAVSTIADANLTFNLNSAVAGQGTELNVGSTAITFGAGMQSTTLTLNLQGINIIAANTDYVLIAGVDLTQTGASTSQYSGLTLGTSTGSLSSGLLTPILNSGNDGSGNLTLSLSSGAAAYYGANSHLFLYQNSAGVDDIEIEVVPEPGTWALMLGGLALLLVIQRRKNSLK